MSEMKFKSHMVISPLEEIQPIQQKAVAGLNELELIERNTLDEIEEDEARPKSEKDGIKEANL